MKLCTRQVALFLALICPLGKLILMPARLAGCSGNDLLFPVLAQLGVQAALVFGALLLARRGKTVYAMIREGAGALPARVFALLFAALLLFCAALPVLEQKLLVRSIFYDTIPAYLVFTPFFLFAAYLGSRPLCALGRLWDILAPLAGVGLAGILIFSAGSADLGALAPAGAAGSEGFWQGARAACGWFCDALLVLALAGRFDYTKGFAWKGTLCYLAGGGILILFLAVFYGVFGELAVIQVHAFARVSAFFSGSTVLGRIDYVFIFALAFVMTFLAALPMQEAAATLAEAFGGGRTLPALLAAGESLAMLAFIYLLNFRVSQTVEVLTGTLFWVYPAAAAGALFVCALCRGRQHESLS